MRCHGTLKGNLYSATGHVAVEQISLWPEGKSVLLCPRGNVALAHADWSGVDTIVVGGETVGIPRDIVGDRVRIDTSMELTVEAALAIALYEWRNYAKTETD